MSIQRERSKASKEKGLKDTSLKTSTSSEKEPPLKKKGEKRIIEDIQEIREILIRNIIIMVCTVIFLVALFPLLLDAYYVHLWTYSHNNIYFDFSYIELEEIEDFDFFDLDKSLTEGLLKALLNILFNFVMGNRVIYFFLYKISRLIYLVLISTLLFFMALFFLLSIIMQNRIKFRFVFLSILISSVVSLSLMFVLIPNDAQIMTLLLNEFETLQNPNELFLDVPALIIKIIYSFYIGFAIIIFIHLLIVTIIQSMFSRIE